MTRHANCIALQCEAHCRRWRLSIEIFGPMKINLGTPFAEKDVGTQVRVAP